MLRARESAVQLELRALAARDGRSAASALSRTGPTQAGGREDAIRLRRSIHRPAGWISPRPTNITRRCSVSDALGRIEVPGLIVHAMDDPFIGAEPFLQHRETAGLCGRAGAARRASRLPEPTALDGRLAAGWIRGWRPGCCAHWADELLSANDVTDAQLRATRSLRGMRCL